MKSAPGRYRTANNWSLITDNPAAEPIDLTAGVLRARYLQACRNYRTLMTTRINARSRVRLRLCTCALLLLSSRALLAQTAPAQTADPQALLKYDKNHNGVLDAAETAAMEADQAKVVPQTAAAAADPGDLVVLSPFEVNGAMDKGYLATNTLSGTRLNSKIEDLGSSISVVTKQQMEDLGVRDLNDIFLYEANTEGTGNYTDFSVDRNGAVNDSVASDPNNANRVRGIASANQSRGNFATSGRIPLDTINIDAVEISRGPNASIFGLGNASGTVNVIPARASLQRETTRLEFRGDDIGSTRSALDINRPLIRNVLGIRASAVYQEDAYRLKPSGSHSERYNGMITFQPFKYTTIRGSTEYYQQFARRPNSMPPRDGVSYWESVGKPTWDPTTSTMTRNGVQTVVPYISDQTKESASLAPGLESGGPAFYATPSLFVEADGSIPLYMVTRESRISATTNLPTPDAQGGNNRFVQSAPAPRVGPLAQTIPGLADKQYYDWQSVNITAPNWQTTRARTFTLEIEQFLLNTPRNVVATQLGWNREESQATNYRVLNNPVVYVDVNEKLLDGRPNPYFLRPYVSATAPQKSVSPQIRDIYRGQIAYQLTLHNEKNWVRWLGDHSLSGYSEYKNSIDQTVNYVDAIVDDHTWLTAGTARGNASRGTYRYYLGDNQGDNIDYAPTSAKSTQGTYSMRWYNAATQQWVDESVTIGEAFNSAPGRTRRLVKTMGAVLQDRFLDDRIVATFGQRQDISLTRTSAAPSRAPDGIGVNLVSSRTWPNDWIRREGKTKQSGVSVKPLRQIRWIDRAANEGGTVGYFADVARSLNFYVNKSDSFTPSTAAHNLLGDILPDPTGEGKDYGFWISLMSDNRLVLRMNWYDTTQKNSRAGDSGIIATRAARLDFSNTTGGSDRFNLYRNATEWTTTAHPEWSAQQVEEDVARQMGFPMGQLASMNSMPVSETSDVSSRGKEIELNYNPTRNITGRITVGQMQTIDSRMSPSIAAYIASRWDLWTTIIDPRYGTPWWTTLYGTSSAQDFYNVSVLGPYKLAVANQGKPKSQIREWSTSMVGAVGLAQFTDNKWLSRVRVTGTARWADKAAIGYFGDPNDPNAYDPNRPIFDKARWNFDAGVSYQQRILKNRVSMRVQLNVRNLTEGGRLQPVGTLPNGMVYNYRIVDPRLFQLTAAFDF